VPLYKLTETGLTKIVRTDFASARIRERQDLQRFLRDQIEVLDPDLFVLREAILPLAEQVELAFIFGSIARGEERVTSDVDVLVVGDASFEEVVYAFYPTQEKLGREVNPVVMSMNEFSAEFLHGDRFVSCVVNEPKIFLIGGGDDFGELVAEWPDQGASG